MIKIKSMSQFLKILLGIIEKKFKDSSLLILSYWWTSIIPSLSWCLLAAVCWVTIWRSGGTPVNNNKQNYPNNQRKTQSNQSSRRRQKIKTHHSIKHKIYSMPDGIRVHAQVLCRGYIWGFWRFERWIESLQKSERRESW